MIALDRGHIKGVISLFRRVTVKEQIRNARQSELARNVRDKENIDNVAVTSAMMLEDNMVTAETVAMLLIEIEELKGRVSTLEGGK